MIRFEHETRDLDAAELEVLPLMVAGLRTKIVPENAITGGKIRTALQKRGIHLSGSRIQKIINYIRRHGLVDLLVASSKGYYVATSHEDVREYIDSLLHREAAIAAMRQAISYQLTNHQTR
jgi:hypothetical protein